MASPPPEAPPPLDADGFSQELPHGATAEVVSNPDGSKTRTVKNADRTTIATTIYPDKSTKTVNADSFGKPKSISVVRTNPDGSVTEAKQTVSSYDGTTGTVVTTTLKGDDGSVAVESTYTNPAYPNSDQHSLRVTRPDGSDEYRDARYPDIVSYTDPSGKRVSKYENGTVLTPAQINAASNKANGPLGNGGFFGLGSNPIKGAIDAGRALAIETVKTGNQDWKTATGVTLVGPSAAGGGGDTSGLAAAIAASDALGKKFGTAYDESTKTAAPTAGASLIEALHAQGSSPVTYQDATKGGAIDYGTVTAGQSTAAIADPSVRAALANYNTTDELAARAKQGELVTGLEGAIAGKDPSVAAILLRQATDRNVANQYALAAASPGMNAGLSQRQAMIGAADLNSKAAADNAILRAKEIVDARAQLADVLGTQRAADINVATTTFNSEQGVNNDFAGAQNTRSNTNAMLLNASRIANAGNETTAAGDTARNKTEANTTAASLANAIELNNAKNRLDTSQFNATQTQTLNQFNASEGNKVAAGNADRKTDISKYNVTAGLSQQTIDALAKENAAKNALDASGQTIQGQGVLTAAQTQKDTANGALISSLVSAYAKSDRDAKTKIERSDDDMSDLLSSLKSYSFDYKDPTSTGASPGRHFGVMAQDLEKSRAGKAMVKDTPEGKMVDTSRAIMAALSALGSVDKRLSKIERRT